MDGPYLPPLPGDNKTDRCYLLEKSRYNMDNTTTSFYINLRSDYNGIPEVLLINLIAFAVGILCFTYMRRWFWNYGRMTLHRVVSRKDMAKDYNAFSHLTTANPETKQIGVEEEGGESTESVSLDYFDTGYCGWLPLLFRLKDIDILRKCGPDALQYARFQRVIILYLTIVMCLCLIVILPINLTNGFVTSLTHEFRATTIANVHPNSQVLWVHILITISFLAMCYWAIRRFMNPKYTYEGKDAEELVEAHFPTIAINGLPYSAAGRTDLITKFFSEAYPELTVVSVQFAYDVEELGHVERRLDVAEKALLKARTSSDDPLIAPHRCGMLWCCGRNIRATTYYENEVQRLKTQRSELKTAAEGKPVPFCLVTFSTVEQAQSVVADFKRFGRGTYRSKAEKGGKDLKASHWLVKIAPRATDIKWENLSIKYRFPKWLAVNFLVFLLLFFLSTPSMVINVWFSVGRRFNMTEVVERSPFLAHMVPSLLLLVSSTLLPYIIAAGEEWTYHTTKSGKNLSLMTKTFVFMLFMVLLLPSLGLQSFYAVIRNIIDKKYILQNQWECIFLQDTVSFFVNFLISTTLIGLVLELLRTPHLIYLAYRACKVASKFELESARLASIFPFPFGLNYAYMLVIFAVTIVYSVVCPLITIFGLLYFILKYLIDRYNMYFVYDSIDISPKLHRRATDFLLLSCLLAQMVLLAFIVSQSLKIDDHPYSQIGFMIAAFILSILAYTGHLTFKFFPRWLFRCGKYKELQEDRDVNQNVQTISSVDEPDPSTSETELSHNQVIISPSINYGAIDMAPQRS